MIKIKPTSLVTSQAASRNNKDEYYYVAAAALMLMLVGGWADVCWFSQIPNPNRLSNRKKNTLDFQQNPR
eukprot:scaffold4007_cov49-Cyclotella_meneghiniana.AAC.11